MTSRYIIGVKVVIMGCFPLLTVGCDAGNTQRLLSAGGAVNQAGSSGGGDASTGGMAAMSTSGGGSNMDNTGGDATVTPTGGAPNQAGTGGAPNLDATGGTPNSSATGGTPNVDATGGASNPGNTGGTSAVTVATGGTATVTDTGGAAATGGAASSGGSSAADGSYYVAGVWSGYMWDSATGTGSTIAPTDFMSHTPGTAFCASGSVGPMTDYSGVALLGYNINQARGATTLGTWTPASTTSGGISVNVSNNGTSVLRVQIQGPSGATDATDRWCATITLFNQQVLIPWTSFNTSCWDGLGTRYAGQPLEAVMILVPGDNLSVVPFNFCLNSISG